MAIELKKVDKQVIVITGASSGIGLATARLASRRGARLVLAARSSNALEQLVDEIRAGGGAAIHVVADVGKEADVQTIASAAQEQFGGFDTWVNNAGTSIYGKLLDVPIEDLRRLFETNFWGVVYGSLKAAEYLKHRGGAIINIGSTLSDRAIPVQGMYSASKHAVKGFTDALRMELEREGIPVSVTLVKPGAIDTPYPHNAKNYLNVEPKQTAPVYSPETVARAILHCAETPERDVFVGAGGKIISVLGKVAPRLTDKLMELRAPEQQMTGESPQRRNHNALDRPTERLEERGGYPGHVAESSLYTELSLRPVVTGLLLASAMLAAASLLRVSTARRGW